MPFLRLIACLVVGVAAAGMSATPCRANVRLPAFFSNHMVLQRNAAAEVWGWADPGEEVSVEIAGKSKTIRAGADGKWRLKLDPMEASKPQQMIVRGNNTIAIDDVLLGEVWLCSGQSNMVMSVDRAKDAEQERAAARFPEIREFKTTRNNSKTVAENVEGEWTVCSPETVGRFSATAYFFAREIHRATGAPVGLLVSAVGGTPIELWVASEAQTNDPALRGFFEAQEKEAAATATESAKADYEQQLAAWRKAAKEAKAANKSAPRRPRDPAQQKSAKGDIGGLFNGMIAPLAPYTIAGAIWYQGEANTRPAKAPYYRAQLTRLVESWRKLWGQGDFPFAWVQLPNMDRDESWSIVRDQMRQALALPNTGMAITIDIGEAKNVHPLDKQDVGKRLAMWALATVYGKHVAASGPLVAEAKPRGNEVLLSFKHTDGGLVVRGGELKSFEVAGDDKAWHAAKAKIEGTTVIVSSPEVARPTAVRYAWDANPAATLYNEAGLPASPFRIESLAQ